ncbi:hypothetical protein [Gordonia sihwensis]|uniref:hypothetical protein n=1 Tax=Gordonia sihwensis TaxID=173559 RepID=UPI002417BE61|nr:hypothetical protein [Gordonia sihwensis]WFN91482.1 hypothetical protein P5P27_11885 [Gordonia sihwensis]WFN91540.1 hypothetical protein P5P27_12175 [Gordonia sihwensis]
MTDPLAIWWTIPVTVRRLLGSGPYGDRYADPTVELGRLSRKTRLVRNAAGEETVASARWSGPLDTPPIPSGSRVTLPGESHERTVIASGRNEAIPGVTPNHYRIEIE